MNDRQERLRLLLLVEDCTNFRIDMRELSAALGRPDQDETMLMYESRVRHERAVREGAACIPQAVRLPKMPWTDPE